MRDKTHAHRESSPDHFVDEDEEWLLMTPAQRMMESGRLWAAYIALGGSLDPEPDPQSPFYFPEAPRPLSAHRRPSVHHLRGGGV